MTTQLRGIKNSIGFILALTGGICLCSHAEEAEKPALDELLSDGENCLLLTLIDRTEVLDKRSILFYTRGGDICLNRLPHDCPGLRGDKAFMYRTSLNKLCNVDTITVLDSIGFGYSRGASCGLGKFHPVSEEMVRTLKEMD